MSGRVVHFEIPADDLDRARAFYREAFGWTINSVPELNYTMVSTTPSGEDGVPTEPGGINGGMMARQGRITAPVLVVEVDDIDATLPTIEKLGGAVVEPKMTVGEMGFAAYFTDTEGNVIGLWQSVST